MGLVVISNSFAQVKDKSISKTDEFSAKSGTLIKKTFIDISNIKGESGRNYCKIQVLNLTDLITTAKLSAVKFENDKRSNSVDADELDALIKSIKIIKEKVITTIPTTYTEVEYFSRGGFSAGCFSKDSSWTFYIKIDKYFGDSYVFLETSKIDELITSLETAKTKL